MRLILVALSLFSTVHAYADEHKLSFSIQNPPFKSCNGKGNSPLSYYTGSDVTVGIRNDSIQVSSPTAGKRETYASLKEFCGIDISKMDVLCSDETESYSEDNRYYTFKKACRVPVPGVPNRNVFYRLDLDLSLEIKTVGGRKTAFGSLNCVTNDKGFRGLNLSDCK